MSKPAELPLSKILEIKAKLDELDRREKWMKLRYCMLYWKNKGFRIP